MTSCQTFPQVRLMYAAGTACQGGASPEVPEAQFAVIPRRGNLVGLLSSKVNVSNRHRMRLRDLCCPLQGAHIPHLQTCAVRGSLKAGWSLCQQVFGGAPRSARLGSGHV